MLVLTETITIGDRDSFEDLVNSFRGEDDLLLLGVFIGVLPLGRELQTLAPDDWLVSTAAREHGL